LSSKTASLFASAQLIGALMLLEPELDKNYSATKTGAYPYKDKAAAAISAAK
jgi:hypothetical protein